MALPLGNIVIVETTDKQTVLLVRNSTVGEGRGFCVFPGGHPEPSALIPPPREGDGDRVLRELWDGARREVLEELFLESVQVNRVEQMQFLGIVARKKDGKASMAFGAKLFLTGDEVLKAYEKGNIRTEESVRMIVLPIEKIGEVAKEGVAEGVLVMPEHIGAAALWVQLYY